MKDEVLQRLLSNEYLYFRDFWQKVQYWV